MQISSSLLSRQIRTECGIKSNISLGITALQISKNGLLAIVGTETGFLLRVDLKYAVKVSKLSKAPEIGLSGLVFIYQPQLGPVYSISLSPFNQNLFLAGCSDGSITIFDMRKVNPLDIWTPSTSESSSRAVLSLQWSPHYPTVFGCVCVDSNVYVFDLQV